MRKILHLTAAAATIAAVLWPMTVAAAAPAVTHDVLTINKVGGPNVKVGAVLTASLSKGATATFFTPHTRNGVTCRRSTFFVTVKKNPPRPGTAIESLTKQTFAKCTVAGITEVLGVNSVTIQKSPYKTTISDSTGNPTAVFKVSTKLSLRTTLGSIFCTYGTAAVKGKASNSGQLLTFTNQVFTKSTGPAVCPRKGNFSATFGPVIDTSVRSHPHVFVN